MSFKSNIKSTKKTDGKTQYFFGIYQGEIVWLTEASWDCDWYWGFGYIGNRNCHHHFDSMFKDVPFYDDESNLAEKGDFVAPHLTRAERWKLADLFKSFYTLHEAAAVVAHGGSNLSDITSFTPSKAMACEINKQMLPEIFKEIYEILTPKEI